MTFLLHNSDKIPNIVCHFCYNNELKAHGYTGYYWKPA